MDLRKIKKLIELLEESGIAELEVRTGEDMVRIVRCAPSPTAAVAAPPSQRDASPGPVPASGTTVVAAPMAGTFYAAPEPGAPAFVTPGSRVSPGEVLCIIESMKMMNEITATAGGTIVEVLVANGEPIATGQTLFRLA